MGIAALAITTINACTVSKPVKPKLSFSFATPLDPPSAGAMTGDRIKFVYFVSGAPSDSRVVMERREGTAWKTLTGGPATSGGQAAITTTFGRVLYRLSLRTPTDKVLTSVTHTLDGYSPYTFGTLFNLPYKTTGPDNFFAYYFRDEFETTHTSCRQMTIIVYNANETQDESYTLKFTNIPGHTYTDTVKARVNTPSEYGFGPSLGGFVDVKLNGPDMYGFGRAVCFTTNGTY